MGAENSPIGLNFKAARDEIYSAEYHPGVTWSIFTFYFGTKIIRGRSVLSRAHSLETIAYSLKNEKLTI